MDDLLRPEPNWYEALMENLPWHVPRMIWSVAVHLVLSLHNGWIDPRLRLY